MIKLRLVPAPEAGALGDQEYELHAGYTPAILQRMIDDAIAYDDQLKAEQSVEKALIVFTKADNTPLRVVPRNFRSITYFIEEPC